VKAAYKKGFDVVVVNHRGLGGLKLTTPKLYSSIAIDDFSDAIDFIDKKYPGRKLFALGASLGGNILGNILGYQGEKCKLTAGCVISAPILTPESASNLPPTLFGAYDRGLGKSF